MIKIIDENVIINVINILFDNIFSWFLFFSIILFGKFVLETLCGGCKPGVQSLHRTVRRRSIVLAYSMELISSYILDTEAPEWIKVNIRWEMSDIKTKDG